MQPRPLLLTEGWGGGSARGGEVGKLEPRASKRDASSKPLPARAPGRSRIRPELRGKLGCKGTCPSNCAHVCAHPLAAPSALSWALHAYLPVICRHARPQLCAPLLPTLCSAQCIVMGFAVGTLFLQQGRDTVFDAQVRCRALLLALRCESLCAPALCATTVHIHRRRDCSMTLFNYSSIRCCQQLVVSLISRPTNSHSPFAAPLVLADVYERALLQRHDTAGGVLCRPRPAHRAPAGVPAAAQRALLPRLVSRCRTQNDCLPCRRKPAGVNVPFLPPAPCTASLLHAHPAAACPFPRRCFALPEMLMQVSCAACFFQSLPAMHAPQCYCGHVGAAAWQARHHRAALECLESRQCWWLGIGIAEERFGIASGTTPAMSPWCALWLPSLCC